MIWKKITIETTPEAVDRISYTLGELGVGGIEVEDRIPLSEADKKAMFIDILPELPPDNGIAYVSCYTDGPEAEAEELAEQIREELEGLRAYLDVGSGAITIGETEDKDWVNNWKEFFHPFRLEDLLIKPVWVPESDVEQRPGDILIEIDPGTAFGTGSHETTRLCIAQIRKYMTKGAAVLDVGCGSGILSVIAGKLGAGQVFGVDIDPLAVTASYENLAANHMEGQKVHFMQGDILGDDGFPAAMAAEGGLPRYDVLAANILADVIIPLSGQAARYLNPEGVFISSGILNTKEAEVRQALTAHGFKIMETTYLGDWVCFTAKQG